MSIRNKLVALAVLAALSFVACGGGGTASSGLPQVQPAPPSSGTTQTAKRSYEMGSAAASYDLPALVGFSGTLSLPAAEVPANTRLDLTSAIQAPAGAPDLADARRRAQSIGTFNVYFYTTITLSSTVTFATLPGLTVTLPATVNPGGLLFLYAISDPKPANGTVAQFRTEGLATVAGQRVTFVPSSTSLTLLAGQSYTIAFYAISAIAQPTPTPISGPNIYIAGNDSVQTYTASGVRTTPTITGLGGLSALAVDSNGKIYVARQDLSVFPDRG
jgi:hypothetical protein